MQERSRGQGRAVLLSSRLMSEVGLTADDLVIIGRGRILDTTTVAAFVAGHSAHSIRVATPEPDNCTRCSKPRRRSPS